MTDCIIELNRTQSTTLTTLSTASESLENPNSFDVLYADCRPLYLLLLCWCARVCVIALVKMKFWGGGRGGGMQGTVAALLGVDIFSDSFTLKVVDGFGETIHCRLCKMACARV